MDFLVDFLIIGASSAVQPLQVKPNKKFLLT